MDEVPVLVFDEVDANVNAPLTRFQTGAILFGNRAGRNYLVYGVAEGAIGGTSDQGITSDAAFQLDNKLDDGTANTGRIQAIDEDLTLGGNTGTTNGTHCHNAGVYRQADETNICAIAYRLSLG